MSPGPYRRAERALSMDWTTEADAEAGVEAIVELLADSGVDVAPADRFVLRATAMALVEAEPDAAVFVGWRLGAEVNDRLARAGRPDRLCRLGETSTRWVLADPAEREARRARGEVLLEGPPPIGFRWSAVGAAVAALALLVTIVAALIAAGAWTALAFWSVALAVHLVLAARLGADASGTRRGLTWAAEAVVLGVPVVVLIADGRLVWLGGVLAAAAASFVLRRRAAPAAPG